MTMYSSLSTRNERKHKFTALLYTIGVLAFLAGLLIFSGQLPGIGKTIEGYFSPDKQENEGDVQSPVAAIELFDHRGGNG